MQHSNKAHIAATRQPSVMVTRIPDIKQSVTADGPLLLSARLYIHACEIDTS